MKKGNLASSQLAKNTKKFWSLSLIRRGMSEEEVSTGVAIRSLNRILESTSPRRLLFAHAMALSESIINGGSKNADGKGT